MPEMIANKAFPYAGVRLQAGERFEARAADFRALRAVKLASEAPADEEGADAKPEPKAAKGTYNRRDLKAK